MAGIDSKPRYVFLFISDRIICIVFRDRKDLDDTKCQNHEQSVYDVVDTISNMMNPFSKYQARLINIKSGVELQNDVACSFLGAEKLGEVKFNPLNSVKAISTVTIQISLQKSSETN